MAAEKPMHGVRQLLVQLKGQANTLGGTLATPFTAREVKSVAIIIPGSGNIDRDGNSANHIAGSPYESLALQLAKAGVASIRIDKRGFYLSSAGIEDANEVTLDDYMTDALAWVAKAKAITGKKCIWLIGHSEGAMVAEKAALIHPESICGLVLIGAPGHRVNDLLKEQLRQNPANARIQQAADSAIDQLAAGHDVDASKLPAPLQALFADDKQRLWKSEFALDPAKALAGITLPVLVIQGGKDIQVPPSEANLLHSQNTRARVVVVQNMNHMLKQMQGDSIADNLASYADPTVTVDPVLPAEIIKFMEAHSRAGY